MNYSRIDCAIFLIESELVIDYDRTQCIEFLDWAIFVCVFMLL